jgi:hypothetical protein
MSEWVKHRWRSKEYRAWCHAKERCFNPNCREYHNYGGRGITMSKEWSSSFKNFIRDMGPSPKGLTLDRVDNGGNYEVGNCRWATYTEQANNRRPRAPYLSKGNKFVRYRGQNKTLAQWSRILNIPGQTISWRLARGYSLDKVFSFIPCYVRGKHHPQGRKTRCPHGHLFDKGNTYWRPDGGRGCRACISKSQKRKRLSCVGLEPHG